MLNLCVRACDDNAVVREDQWIIFTCNLHLLSGSIGRAFDVLFMGFLLPMPAFGGLKFSPLPRKAGGVEDGFTILWPGWLTEFDVA